MSAYRVGADIALGHNSRLAAGTLPQSSAKFSVPRFVLAVELSNDGVFFTCAETHRTIVVLLVDARVAMTENRTGEVRMFATVDGGCGCAGSPE